MNGTEDISTRIRTLAGETTFPFWLADARARATRALDAAQFPGRKSESWKYTRLGALEGSGALAAHAGLSHDPLPAGQVPDIDGWRVVVVNGRFAPQLSSLPGDGSLVVSSLVQLPDAEQATARALASTIDTARLPFAAFNEAAFSDGLYVRVPKGKVPGRPLHVIFHSTGHTPATVQARLLVQLDEQAALTLIEQYTGDGDSLYTNAGTAIALGRSAKLDWLRVQMEDHRQFFTGGANLRLQQDSTCNGWLLMSGSRLKRNDITCEMAAPGASLNLQGVFVAGSSEHVDNQIGIEHAAPHATSTQVFKGLVGGDGRAVFNGRIHIHPGAKQTSAELVNNNLLLSADAEVDTKPELEIYNDDVKCAHGATVGQLNETAVFYLQSRGIPKADAELMLALGFVNALVDSVPLPALAGWLRGEFGRWFADRGKRT